jgi:hypothetical protein
MYIPKILITQPAGTDRMGFDNAHGEVQLFIENDLTNPNETAENESDNFPNPVKQK